MVTLEGMKEYGYGDDASWQPAVAARCLNAAKEYYLNAGVKERESALYDQAVYLLAMLGVGVYFARGQKTEEDYLMGGRNLNWFLVALSVCVTVVVGRPCRIRHSSAVDG